MRLIFTLVLLFSVVLVPLTSDASSGQRAHAPTVPESIELLSSIDDIAAIYNSEQCGECHEEIYDQWKHSGNGLY